jgi:lysophospholipase L1-like esterase
MLKTNKMKFNPKFLKTIICIQMLLFYTIAEAQNPPFWNDIQAFKKQDSIAMPAHYKTLFIGSSSFTKWKTLEKDLPEFAPLNRAFGGSTLLDVIRYREDIINKYNPERIVIYCGENDIASSDTVTGKIVLERFKVLYQHIREKFPKIDIYYVSLKPCPLRWSMRERMMDGNTQIKRFCKKQKHAYFISIWNQMLENSEPIPSIFLEDNLHMNAKGYRIWIKEIRKEIKN